MKRWKLIAIGLCLTQMGFSQDNTNWLSKEWLDKAKEKSEQEKKQDKEKEEKEKAKALSGCKDFPVDKWGKPENYIVFHPVFLGTALEKSQANVSKRLLTAKGDASGNYNEITYATFIVKVNSSLRDFANSDFVREKVVKSAREFTGDEKLSLAERLFWKEVEYRRNTQTQRREYEKFNGCLTNQYSANAVRSIDRLEFIGNARTQMTIAKGDGWYLWDEFGAGLFLGRVPTILISFKPERNFCYYFKKVDSKVGDDTESMIKKFFTRLMSPIQTGFIECLMDWKGWKMTTLKVDTPLSKEMTLWVASMDATKEMGTGEDMGLIARIDDRYVVACYSKEHIEKFYQRYKKGILATMEAIGINPQFASICGAVPYLPFAHANAVRSQSIGSTISGLNELQKTFAYQGLQMAKTYWYPNPVCIEFNEHVCTLWGGSPLEVYVEGVSPRRKAPLGQETGGLYSHTVEESADKNLEVLVGKLDSLAEEKK